MTDDSSLRIAVCKKIEQETGMVTIHPHDNYEVMAGQVCLVDWDFI